MTAPLPTVKVEIAFATTPDDPSPAWVDVSQWVRVQPGITITRGRQDQFSEVQPSKCTLTLINSDGRFTPGNVNSPYYPNVKKGRRIKVWVIDDGSFFTRFTGYVDEWPVTWADSSATVADVSVTATSRMGRLDRGSELPSIVETEYLADTPTAYYPYGDPEGTTRAGNVSTTLQPTMSALQIGTGGSITFGSATGPGTDGLTAALFSPANSTNGALMRALPDQAVVTSAHTTFSMECFFLTSSVTEQDIMRLDLQTGTGEVSLMNISATGKLHAAAAPNLGANTYDLTSAATVADGNTHHALIRETISGGNLTATLFLDGVSVATSTVAYTAFGSRDRLAVGGAPSGGFGMFGGTISHVAIRSGTTELTADRVLQHANSGLTGFSGERSDQRIARLARYAGVPSAEVTVETGQSTSIVNQVTNGLTPLALMRDVVRTEAGVLFDTKDGVLRFRPRSYRYNAESSLTLAAAGDGELQANLEPRLDDQGLVNDVTASREGGVSVRAVDTASIADYGIYRDEVRMLTTSDNEVTDAANWKLYTSSTPQVAVPVAEADLTLATPLQRATILTADIGSRITLGDLPSQAPATTMDFFVEGTTDRITAERYLVAFNLSSAALSGVWQLDSAVYSVLNTSTRLAY